LPEYFVFALRAQKRQMLSRASTTTVPYLNKENCESILIPVVPIAEQQKISSIFFDLENQMYQFKKRKEQFVSIKQNFINSIFL
jgi:restriction endonuclease S subunit